MESSIYVLTVGFIMALAVLPFMAYLAGYWFTRGVAAARAHAAWWLR